MSDILEEVSESKLRYRLFESVTVVVIQTFQVETSHLEVEQRQLTDRQGTALQHVPAHPVSETDELCAVSLWGEGQLSDKQLQICHFIPVVPAVRKQVSEKQMGLDCLTLQ